MMVQQSLVIVTTLCFIWSSYGEIRLDHTFSFQPHSNGSNAHGVSASEIILKDKQTIEIRGLHYDGKGPAAYWMVGSGPPPVERPNGTPGFVIPNEEGRCDVLKAYNGEDIKLTLPANYTIGPTTGSQSNSIEWLAIYCVQYKHNFGHVRIQKEINLPEPNPNEPLPQDCPQNDNKKSDSDWNRYKATGKKGPKTLMQTFSFHPHGKGTAHGLRAGQIIIKDDQTIEINNIYYDGKGPDAFWMVGYGLPPTERPGKVPGHKIPNESRTCAVLKSYNGETITLILPSNYTFGGSKPNSIEWLAMYCITYKHNFGHVQIPKDLDLPKYDSQKALPMDCGQQALTSYGQKSIIAVGIFGLIIVQFVLN